MGASWHVKQLMFANGVVKIYVQMISFHPKCIKWEFQ
jgi:hypothetical protein